MSSEEIVPLASLAQSSAALQAPGSYQESQKQREGRRENLSFLPQPHLARKLAGLPQPNLSVIFGWGIRQASAGDAPVHSPW